MRLPSAFRPVPLLAALLAPGVAHAQSCPAFPAPAPDTAGVMATVRYLSDPRLDGRAPGTAGDVCARRYVAAAFARLGLTPAGDGGGPFQAVPTGLPGRFPTSNVVALLPAADPAMQDGAIVVGAHLDHLGRAAGDTLFPGADDNASGVAVLLRAAELLATGPRPARPVVFVAFTLEEAMRDGSTHFVAAPPVPLASLRAMVNLDMVGRLRDGALRASGTATAPFWEPALRSTGDGVRWEGQGEVERGSDHMPFHRAGVPVLYLTTGMHADHHRPTDVPERIDADGVERIARVTAAVVRQVAAWEAPVEQ